VRTFVPKGALGGHFAGETGADLRTSLDDLSQVQNRCLGRRQMPILRDSPGSAGAAPSDFSKKDELYKKTLELRAGHLQTSEFSEYLQGEKAKIETARGKLHEGDAPILLEGLALWERSLAQAEVWLSSSSDFDLQAALNLATQADDCINRSIQEQFEIRTELVRTFQAEERLRANPLPDLPEDGLLVGFELRNNPK
jgi:hypothetical protein